MDNNTKKQPVHKVQFGNIKVAIWKNTTADGKPYFNFGLTRSYKDTNNQWQEQTISLNLGEIAKAGFALAKVYQDYYTLPQFRKNADSADTAADTAEAPANIPGQY